MRFQNSQTIPGTRKLHSFVPISRDTVKVRPYSLSITFKEEKVIKQEIEREIDAVSGYVTCEHNAQWWLAFAVEVGTENAEVKLTFLHPHGPSRSFKYPSIPDILTKVNPKTPTGRGHTYTLGRKEKQG